MKARHPHDFVIGELDHNGRSYFIAHCTKPRCNWFTAPLSTRTKAVTAAHWHQATEDVKAL